jgi:hypothetical protein
LALAQGLAFRQFLVLALAADTAAITKIMRSKDTTESAGSQAGQSLCGHRILVSS